MKIAYYAPLKSPNHPVPSGDRLMARMLLQALRLAGHDVALVSELRSFSRTPEGHEGQRAEAERERARILAHWKSVGRPDLWLTYHVYYKAPDFLGPALCADAGIPYVTVEASWSARRNREGWEEAQAAVLHSVRAAAVNICMTERDREGLIEAAPEARTARLKPFLDAGEFLAIEPAPEPGRLVTVAMMREGDKLASYRALAGALRRMREPFVLDVIGGGPCRAEVERLLDDAAPGRVILHGELSHDGVMARLARGSVFVWPGIGEAYGMVYLEAAAVGLPCIAYRTGGVPEVVDDGVTGLLVPAGDEQALAGAMDRLLADADLRLRLAGGARTMVAGERRIEQAARQLDALLKAAGGTGT